MNPGTQNRPLTDRRPWRPVIILDYQTDCECSSSRRQALGLLSLSHICEDHQNTRSHYGQWTLDILLAAEGTAGYSAEKFAVWVEPCGGWGQAQEHRSIVNRSTCMFLVNCAPSRPMYQDTQDKGRITMQCIYKYRFVPFSEVFF